MDLLSMDLSPGQRQAYRESSKTNQMPPLSPVPTRVTFIPRIDNVGLTDIEKMSEFAKELSLIFEGRHVVALSNSMHCVHPPYSRVLLGEFYFDLAKLWPLYRGDFENPEALTVFGECVKTCYNDWCDSVQHGPFPPPFSLTRAHRRTVRGPHIVMRALLEKGRATLGKDALFVIYNLYRRMPDPMFRVILSFL